MVDRVGQHIDDYRLVRRLGAGSFGEVYLGEQVHNHSQAAIKLLLLKQEDLQGGLEGFIKEASTTFRLKHPHIVQVFSFGITSYHTPYLVMDYASNGTLRERYPKGTRLPLETVISYLQPLASALQHAHDRRVVHRDVKPENVLIGPTGEVWLSDFGIAVTASIESSFSTQGPGGTLPYMAPEQLRGKPQPASDQYALGIMVYEWLCGDRPFQGNPLEILGQHISSPPPPLSEKRPDLSSQVEAIILKALAKDPHDRFTRVQDFVSALAQTNQVDHASLPTTPLSKPLGPTSAMPSLAPSEAVSVQQPAILLPPMPLRDNPTIPSLASQHSIEAGPPFVASSPTPLRTDIPSALPTVSPWLDQREPLISSPSFPPSSPSIPPPLPLLPKVHRWRAPGKLLLTFGLLLFLIIAGSILYPMFHSSMYPSPTPMQLTATAQAAASLATATERNRQKKCIDDYDKTVNNNGTMFGFNAQHTRYNSYECILNANNITTLVQTWTFQFSSNVGDFLFESPTIANGVVYMGSIYALDAKSGQKIWDSSVVFSKGYFSTRTSPAVADGIAYIGSGDNKLYAFDAKSGQKKWVSQPAGDAISSSPVVAGGMVYVSSYDLKIYAFGATSGQQIWVSHIGNPNSTISFPSSSPAIANGIVYVGSYDGKLYAFDARSGQQKWASLPTGDAIDSSPAIANKMVYVGSRDGKLYAFDATSGQQKWASPAGADLYSSPAIANGMVYVGSFDGKLYAFDATSGQQKWIYPTRDSITSSPTVANGIVYVGSRDGKLYAFDARSGQLKWVFTIGAINSSPAVANGMVYVGCDDGKLYAFSLPESR